MCIYFAVICNKYFSIITVSFSPETQQYLRLKIENATHVDGVTNDTNARKLG